MLDNTKWDGRDRIVELTDQIIGASDREAVYVRKWLHQCIALVLNDEKKPYNAEGVLVIQGAQGIGKTNEGTGTAVGTARKLQVMAESDENGKLPRAVEQLLPRIKRIIIGGHGGQGEQDRIHIEWN